MIYFHSHSSMPNDWEEAKDYQDDKWPILLNDSLSFIPQNLFDYFCQVHPFPNSKDVEARFEPYNKTGLIVEAENGNFEGVKFYLSRRADIKAQDIFGETALHYAAENGYFEVTKILVFSGSDPTIIDCHGRSSLDCAIKAKSGDYQKVIPLLAIEVVGHQERWHDYWYRPMQEAGGNFWIDAICINQGDVSERNAQVAIMSTIYSQAEKVYVWLGRQDETIQTARELLNHATEKGHDFDSALTSWYETLQVLPDHIPIETDIELDAIRRLFGRTWFERIWVIQELAHGKDVEIICGPFNLPYKVFHIVFQQMHWVGDNGAANRNVRFI